MLATLVPVTNEPDQRSPRRTSSEEKRIARIFGGAPSRSTGGAGIVALPTVTFAGVSGTLDPHPTSSTVNDHAPMR